MTTTTSPESVTRPGISDHYEPEDETFTRTLGLRPTAYSDDDLKSSHPDQRPCPPWCWVGQQEEYGHEVLCGNPTNATHSMAGAPHVLASLYEGDRYQADAHGHGRVVMTATIEVHLDQIGQGDPTLTVCLRQHVGRESRYDEVLRLTLTDADELSRALAHVVKVAEA